MFKTIGRPISTAQVCNDKNVDELIILDINSGFCVKEIYAFEVLSSTEWNTPGVGVFSPNVFIEITDFINIKKQSLTVYTQEMRQPPHSRSIDNAIRLNVLRGNAVDVDYVEALKLLQAC